MARVSLAKKQLVFLDLETTSLDVTRAEITEIAIVRDPLAPWVSKVRIEDRGAADPRALEISGYNDDEWAGAPAFADIASEVMEHTQDVIIVGHNVIEFDMPILRRWLSKSGYAVKWLGYPLLDTMQLAYHTLVPRGLTRLNLGAVREFLGLSSEGAHTALVDALHTRIAYLKMIEMGIPSRDGVDRNL